VEFISQHFKILPVFPSLQLFGEVKTSLEASGNRIDDFDILIGCTAITNDLILVSDNEKHLRRLPGIVIENWIHREIY
jgi:tRNA(fMet)-specific endonuclease VapC